VGRAGLSIVGEDDDFAVFVRSGLALGWLHGKHTNIQ